MRTPYTPIVADDPSTAVPCIDYKAERILNRQTAHNRSAVQTCQRCGCFHCGRIFAGSLVDAWEQEQHGEATALCPFCDTDAVITGTDEFPVTTALLSLLYMEWFKKEFQEREKCALFVPAFSGRDDYLRKGIPFLLDPAIQERVVGQITLFPTRLFDSAWGNLHDNEVFREAMHTIRNESPGGIVSVRAYFDDDGYCVSDFINDAGEKLPYEPWTSNEQDQLLNLTKTYGNRLKGVITTVGGNQKITLFVG